MIITFVGITTIIFCYSDGVTDVVKSNKKRLLASTDNSAGMKVVKRNNTDVTIQRKTTGHISKEKLNGRFIYHIFLPNSCWYSASCSLLKLTGLM